MKNCLFSLIIILIINLNGLSQNYTPPDGTYTLAMSPNDDLCTGMISFPFNFCFYGVNYTSLCISNNGTVSFVSTYSGYTSSPFPNAAAKLVAAFWSDIDTRVTGTVQYKITPTAMYINWSAVGYYSMGADKLNSFEIIITNGSDPILPPGNNLALCYGDMQWATSGGFGGTPSQVGINNGDGLSAVQVGRFDHAGTDYDGCFGAIDGVDWLDNKTFTFDACALVTTTITGTTSLCQNATAPNITFTAAGGTAPFTFTYNINGGSEQTISTISGNSVSVAAPTSSLGSFVYAITSVLDASTTTCPQPQAGTATVVINSCVSASITGTTEVCTDETPPNVTFTSSGGTSPFTFTYTINGGSNQTVTANRGNSVTVSVPTSTVGSFTYSLVSLQDSSTTTAQSGIAIIIVNPLPTATISGTTTVCKDATSPNIVFTGASGMEPYTFTYTVNSGNAQTITTTSGNSVNIPASTTADGTYTYSLVSVQDGTSSSCSQAQSGSATVIVKPLPTATITGTVDVCKGASAPDITFTGASGIAPYTFTYTINGVTQPTVNSIGNSITVSVPTSVVGTFIYALVSVQEASSTACSQSQSGSATVTVNPLPTATITGTIAVCKDATAPNITFTGATGTAPYTFTYTINGVTQPTVNSIGNSITVAVPTSVVGIFAYALVSVQDASSTACSQSQSGSATVTVNPLPTATITGTTTVCKGDIAPSVTFTGAGGTPPYTFTYSINSGTNQTISTTNGNSVNISAPTNTAGGYTYSLISVQDASSTACSQSQSGSVTVTVNPLPTATITGTTTVCKGDIAPSVTFTGAGGTPPYTFTYSINSGTNQTISTINGNSVNISAPTNIAGGYTYSLISVQDASATTCSQAQNGSVTIIVNPLPTATIAGTTAVCKDATAPEITFTGAGGTEPYTFTYSINGITQPTVNSVGNNIIVYVPTSVVGTFNYTLISVKDASSTTCSQVQIGNATVIINSLPTASITGTTEACKNALSPNITFTGSLASAPYTFTYTINGGATQTVTTLIGNSVTVPAPTDSVGTFTYDLISVHDGSIPACSQLQSGSSTITINPKPVADFDFTDICLGDSIYFNDLSTISSGANTGWSWNFGDSSPLNINQNTVYLYSNAGTYNVTLIATTDEGCTDTAIKSTVVHPNPNTQFLAANVCDGNAVMFNNLSTIPTTDTLQSWIWNFGDGSPSNTNQTVSEGHQYTNVGTYTVQLLAVSTFGCSDSATQTVVVNPNPVVSFTASDTSICESLCITFQDLSNIASGSNTQWTWNVGDEIFTNSSQNLEHCYVNDSVYSPLLYTISLTVASDSGCISNLSKNNYITIYPNPKANFSASPALTSIIEPFISLADTSTGTDFWNWNFGNGDTSNVQSPIPQSYADTGIYSIMLITSTQYGCVDTAYQTIRILPDVTFYIPNSFSPNADGKNEIFIPIGIGIDKFEMSIYNRWGDLIFYTDDFNKGWDGTAQNGSASAQEDIYVYVVKMLDGNQKKHYFRGTTTLVR